MGMEFKEVRGLRDPTTYRFAILLQCRMYADARKLKEDALEAGSVGSNRLLGGFTSGLFSGDC